LTNGKRRTRFNTINKQGKGFEKSGGKGGISQKRTRHSFATNPAGRRSLGTSGGKGGGSFADPTKTGLPRRRQPQRDVFARAGMGM